MKELFATHGWIVTLGIVGYVLLSLLNHDGNPLLAMIGSYGMGAANESEKQKQQ